MYEMVYNLGGKLSGEHGIGYKRVALMEKFCNPIEVNLMKAIKKAWDPKLIMNPAKVVSFD